MHVTLRDGRSLSYAEYGDRTGKPVLYFPGTPSSRLMHPPEEPSVALGARIIVIERPGFGESTFQKGRKLLDWPADVRALADALGLDRFPIVGTSAGGPYAAVCARKLPERVTRAAIVGGVGPTDLAGSVEEMPRVRQMGVAVARHAPWLLAAVLWLVANPRRDPGRFFGKMVSGNSPVDQAVLRRPEVRAMLLASYQEATRAGMRGFAQDAIILSSPWGFRLEEIAVPVDLWHGEEDTNVSLSAARSMAATIPSCRATFVPGQGHWLHLEVWGEILSPLLS